jgi:metal-responsive CopG/Arc/MetJ family transcriptional regulator
MKKDTFYQRINITMPTKTLKKLDKIATKGDRSALTTDAVNEYIMEIGKEELRKRMKEGAIALSDLHLQITREWDLLNDPWPEYE